MIHKISYYFSRNGQFRVFDDNGVKIHSQSLYID